MQGRSHDAASGDERMLYLLQLERRGLVEKLAWINNRLAMLRSLL